jgi:hypothetical protein
MNLLDVKKAKREKQLKIVQIGESGSGKTHRTLTAIDFGPMFFFDCDKKLANYASSGKLTDAQLENIDYICPNTTAEIVNKLQEFSQQGDKLKYATIVLDTFSRWNELLVEEIHEELGGKMNIPGWTKVKMVNAKMLKQIFSLPCNVIVNAHLAEKENAIGELGFTAGGSGSASQMLPEFVDECHYLYIKRPNNVHAVQGKGSGKFTVVKTLLTSELEGLNFKSSNLKDFKKFAKIVTP